jgi:superfamily I DNA and/or RNA helicase
LKKQYIENANVIGITCVQSGSKGFSEEYPDFDVVIIDEVSKATPPEILLPMLKGRKTILVGDQHQLPPMLGEDTLQEIVEHGTYTLEEKATMKRYLKQSLFEKLFDLAPDEFKATLKIQYRMHDDIMNAISHFYEDEDKDSTGLISGIEDPDRDRDHGIEGRFIRRNHHLLWIDVPRSSRFAEKTEKKSFYNEAEIEIIISLLHDINDSIKQQIIRGTYNGPSIKTVGVISFYAAQVQKLKEQIFSIPNAFPHLSIRIGTVDRFQGIERDIILASFVRNNPEGTIGFASDYRRINVALSRAKELLIVTGCSQLFTDTCSKRNPKAAKMFTRVVTEVKRAGGLYNLRGEKMFEELEV